MSGDATQKAHTETQRHKGKQSKNGQPQGLPLRIQYGRGGTWMVRGMKRTAHHQPRTPKPGVPCCPEESPVQQVIRYAGGGRYRA